ncbi:MerR family transcriptional regulator [Pendulispora albinea]|uniref:MerR family transcriptional regulator n=1 Tax=Pendulispora albinea TaxID=2741071 RepID=A0ABZ2LYQ5_9BACT
MKGTRRLQLKVGELATRAGVSVRTLHHYDAIGLLRPSHSASGHRLYDQSHVERLLQIKALRQLGFSLDDIARTLNEKKLSLGEALTLRVTRLREEIAARKKLLRRLEAIVQHVDGNRTLSTETIFETMEAMMNVESYFTEEQLAELARRRAALGQEGLEKIQEEWRALIHEVREEADKGTDPSSPRAQELAARWTAIGDAFTGGDRELTSSIRTMWQTETRNVTTMNGFDVAAMRAASDYIVEVMAAKKNS